MYEIKLVEISNDKYPSKIKELSDAPPVLYYKGNLDLLESECVAIIGKRDVEKADLKNASIAGELVSGNGYTVVNGVARGL